MQSAQQITGLWQCYLSAPSSARASSASLVTVDIVQEELQSAEMPMQVEVGMPLDMNESNMTDVETGRTLQFTNFASPALFDIAKQVLQTAARGIGTERPDTASCVNAWSAMKLINGAGLALQRIQYAVWKGALKPTDPAAAASSSSPSSSSSRGGGCSGGQGATIRSLTDRLQRQLTEPALAEAVAAVTAAAARRISSSQRPLTAAVIEADGHTGQRHRSTVDLGKIMSALLNQACRFPYTLTFAVYYAGGNAAGGADALQRRLRARDAAACGLGMGPPPAAEPLISSLERSALLDVLCGALLGLPPGSVNGPDRSDFLTLAISNLAHAMTALMDLARSLAQPVEVAASASSGAAGSFRLQLTPLARRVVALLLTPNTQKVQRCLLERFVLDQLQQETAQQPPQQQQRRQQLPDVGSGGGSGWLLLDVAQLHTRVGGWLAPPTHPDGRPLGDHGLANARLDLNVLTLIQPAMDTWCTAVQMGMCTGARIQPDGDGGSGDGSSSDLSGSSSIAGNARAVTSAAAAAVLQPAEALEGMSRCMVALCRLFRSADPPVGIDEVGLSRFLRPTTFFTSARCTARLLVTGGLLPPAAVRACLPAAVEALAWALAAVAVQGERLRGLPAARADKARIEQEWRDDAGAMLLATLGANGAVCRLLPTLTPQRRDLARRLARAGWYRTLNHLLRLLASAADGDGLLSISSAILPLLVQHARPSELLEAAEAEAAAAAAAAADAEAAAAAPAVSAVTAADNSSGGAGGGGSGSGGGGAQPELCAASLSADLVELLRSLAKLLSHVGGLQDAQRLAAVQLLGAEPGAGTAATATGAAAAGRRGSAAAAPREAMDALEALRALGARHDGLLPGMRLLMDLVLEVLGEPGCAGSSNSSSSRRSASGAAPALVPLLCDGGGAAAAKLRGAAAAVMLAGCRACAARLEAVGLETHPRLPAALRLVPWNAEALTTLTECAHINLTVGTCWLGGPLARWLPRGAALAAAKPRRLLSAGTAWLRRAVCDRDIPDMHFCVDSYRYDVRTAVRVTVEAALTLAAHEGASGEVRAWLLAGGEEAGGRRDPAVAAAEGESPVECLRAAMGSTGLRRELELWEGLAAALGAGGGSQSQATAANGGGGGDDGGGCGAEAEFRRRVRALLAARRGGESSAGGAAPAAEEGQAAAVVLPKACDNPRCGNFGGEREGQLRLRRCARCEAVRYCGAECQLQHWREGHKEECRRGGGGDGI